MYSRKYLSVKAVVDVIAMNMGIVYFDVDDNRIYPSVSDTNNQMRNYRVESLEYNGGDNFRLYIVKRNDADEVTDTLTVANFKKIAYNLNNREYTDMNDNSIANLSDIWDEFDNSIVEYIGVMTDGKTVIVQTDYEPCKD